MDTKMTSPPTWPSGDFCVASTATAPCDNEIKNTNNILEDTYFKPDMSDEAMNSLLDYFEPMDADAQSVKQSPNIDDTANMSPQPVASIEQFSLDGTSPPSASSNSSTTSYQEISALPIHTMPNLTALPMRLHSPPLFQHHGMMVQQTHGAHFSGQRIYGNQHYYQSMSPVQATNGSHLAFGPQYRYPSPYQPQSRQGTVDLMDYSQAIPEDDEFDDVESAESTDPCYAQLLYRCLKEAPDHTLSLKDLYSWVAQHSQKAKDSSSKGWQNSVRHNLSMNAAFERVNASSLVGSVAANKKGSLWRLTESALHRGVISTTRYRKDPKRKPERRSSPALKRQLSGAKGGQATRAASQHRRAMQARSNAMRQSIGGAQRRQLPGYFGAPTSMPGSSRPSRQLGFMPQTAPPQPPSPYLLPIVDNEPFAFTSQPGLEHQQTSSPHTPPQVPFVFDHNASKGFLAEFELGHISHEDRRLFGNDEVDFGAPDTPYSEGSFFTDEAASLGRASCEPIC